MTVYKAKPCVECGTEFVPNSSRSKYCAVCAAKAYRQQAAERARRYRARLEEAKQSLECGTTK